jgi:hypothetical protein
MITYTYNKKYDEDTGEPCGVKVDEKIQRCDWSGESWDLIEKKPYAHYQFHYGGVDPCYGSGGGEYEFSEEFNVEMRTFLGSSSLDGGSYIIRWDYQSEAIEEFKESDFESFDGFFRHIRVRSARQLLEDNVIKPYQLPGFWISPEDLSWEEWQELQSGF